MKTTIDHLKAAEQPFDLFFAEPAKRGNIGHNNPAFTRQSADVLYYYRAAHRLETGPERAKILRAALGRLNTTKPLAIELYRDLQKEIWDNEK